MALLWLINTGESEIYAMYGGEYYKLPPKDICQAPEDAARHIASYYSKRGVRMFYTKEEAVQALTVETEETEEVEGGETVEELGEAVEAVCEECGEDFSQKKRPMQALNLHKMRQHGKTHNG